MNTRVYFQVLWIGACCCFSLAGCDKKPPEETGFTRADSLTGTYLALQDTMLQVWNSMMHDDNRKIKSMQHLLQELMVSNPEKQEELKAFQERLDQLASMRYDQRSVSDTEMVIEYDFVSNSLVRELLALAESQKEFAYNTTLQKLTDFIRAADQRVINYREEYDVIASRFNAFIESNRNFLKEIEEDTTLEFEKKPLFEMAAD